jgi:alkanesulfonate monooxygenase SsuD/methylene tetrahydromethanopterin reductase-like flavin-dependent oxidoreductase (luciferase family)
VVNVRYAIDVPNAGGFGDPALLVQLGVEAERAGWDGCFLWDHLQIGREPLADAWIALTAIATATNRIKMGPIVSPLFRYSPWNLARQSLTLDHLSHGRVILGAGLGSDYFGEISMVDGAVDDKIRAEILDESLAIVTGLWSGKRFSFAGKHYRVSNAHFLPKPIQRPRIPIWIAGTWPHKPPFRRAMRYDGVVAVAGNFGRTISPGETRELVEYIRQIRASEEPFEIVHLGRTTGIAEKDGELVESFAAAGVTWWVEAFGLSDPIATVRARIKLGPPGSKQSV